MPSPTEVRPKNFDLDRVLYSKNGFSIAWGKWVNGTDVLGMRWDGEGIDKGYPKTFGHPVWFIIPDELSIDILKSLLNTPNANNREIAEILHTIIL